jgi:hypothetical protein
LGVAPVPATIGDYRGDPVPEWQPFTRRLFVARDGLPFGFAPIGDRFLAADMSE